MTKLRVLVLAAAAGTALGCGGARASDGGELHIAVIQEAPSLDLHRTTTLVARQIAAGTVWEKLLTLDSRSEAVPELCERFESSGDAKTFTFYLRKGVRFHDGSVMSADDVVASMNRWLRSFAAARLLAGGSRFEKLDEHTVRISFSHPAVTFPDVVAGSGQTAAITTAAACLDEDERGFLRQDRYIGTGPYRFAEWKLGQHILLEKFDGYVPYGSPDEAVDGWAGYKAPTIQRLYFDYVPEDATCVAGFETGQYDVLYNVSAYLKDRVRRIPDAELVEFQAGTIAFVFNKKQGPAANVYFRQAVNAAIRIPDILRPVYGDMFTLGSCYMEDTQPFWKTDAGSEHYHRADTALAKELLAKSGYKGEPFVMLTSNMGNMNQSMEVMRQQLAEIGIRATLTSVDWATLVTYNNDPAKFGIYNTSFASVPVPSLKPFFSPTSAGWSDDPTLQRLVAEFNAARTRGEARERWETLQAYSWEYLPAICMGHNVVGYAWHKRVTGISVFHGLFFWNARIS
ncbi:ABC transporter substrate-binding protein [Treponema endosymbiont of Eucomonympha sp.]|uniref:ABC transporter substrate-binding protein n=1 Tax=Treponema endosymbiont of Eucomonympha sp. TaxID=1580831 RepID=UPI0007510B45|nr:ABC transporter substrate-binding protein [Treponema endosymbiont of Eucomonympha sp.]